MANQQIINSRDSEHALRMSRDEIDSACVDLLKVTKEKKILSRLGTLKPTFNVSSDKVISGAAGGALLPSLADGLTLDMPGASMWLGAIAGSVVAGINVSWTPGGVHIKPRNSPYAYMTSYHKELFIV